MVNGSVWGSVSPADTYGLQAPVMVQPDPWNGPAQSFVAPVGSVAAADGGTAPAIALLGIALLLVLYRVGIELGSE